MSGYPKRYTEKRTLEGHSIFLDGVDGVVRNDGLTVLQDGCNADFLPLNRDLGYMSKEKYDSDKSMYLCRDVNVLDRLANFRANSYRVVSKRCKSRCKES